MKKILVSPSILSADFSKLGEEVAAIENAGADMIHIDVMDGNFVPNITIGADVIKAIRKYSIIPFDVHLMVNSPTPFIETFVQAGADYITVHIESEMHIDKLLNKIRSYGVKVGVSLLPSTSPEVLKYILDYVDLILVMSVNPGFGGQKFISHQLEKINVLRSLLDKNNNNIILSVDGGVNDSNIKEIVTAGADMVVAGNFIFNQGKENYAQQINLLKNFS